MGFSAPEEQQAKLSATLQHPPEICSALNNTACLHGTEQAARSTSKIFRTVLHQGLAVGSPVARLDQRDFLRRPLCCAAPPAWELLKTPIPA